MSDCIEWSRPWGGFTEKQVAGKIPPANTGCGSEKITKCDEQYDACQTVLSGPDHEVVLQKNKLQVRYTHMLVANNYIAWYVAVRR